ncbi:hypothetical protein N7481_012476 [Penicillium waksmanii]|uniref:uncharacterized protein n=1 Tax=Penicillium waksmanii TaxID=69791 RepID=UPI0025479182|nr:uncharacterized protein N7481_012476 [Penicillium waksmanii]KAJ5965762.1 hypothetical protein N7481_012476 [Penicillium waksmanii]
MKANLDLSKQPVKRTTIAELDTSATRPNPQQLSTANTHNRSLLYTAENTGNPLSTGNTLTDEQRADFSDMIKGLKEASHPAPPAACVIAEATVKRFKYLFETVPTDALKWWPEIFVLGELAVRVRGISHRNPGLLDSGVLPQEVVRAFHELTEIQLASSARAEDILHELKEVFPTNLSFDSVMTTEMEQSGSSSLSSPHSLPDVVSKAPI